MQKKYNRQKYCICMAIIFLIGIFGQTDHVKNHPLIAQNEAETMKADAQEASSYIAVETLTKIDDFHITADTGRTVSDAPAGVRGVTLCIAALLLFWFLGSISPKRRICFREKRIKIFRIITFIHRIDGKKKSCFDSTDWIKTGGYFKWKSVQNIRFCL